MRVALDTNILAYAEGINGRAMRDAALALTQRLPPDRTVLPVQTLGELFNVLVRKDRRPVKRARRAIMNWHDALPLISDTTAAVMVAAADLAANHHLGIAPSAPRRVIGG